MKNQIYKQQKGIVSLIILLILYIPIILFMFTSISGKTFDVGLHGYLDSVKPVKLTAYSLFNSSYQKYAEAAFCKKISLYGVMTRTYNTIRYICFKTGNIVIGKNNSLFQESYLNCENCINEFDFADVGNDERMCSYINCIESVNSKLKTFGKTLILCVAPGKCTLYPEDMPENFTQMCEKNAVCITDSFREKISKTDVPYIFFEDFTDELEFPAFYKTGIHWSRTFEQSSTMRLIDYINKITGKNYRNFTIKGIEESEIPFWRDADIYNLLNVWGKPKKTHYFQYITEPQSGNDFEELNVLIQGDSFGEGLERDIFNNIIEDKTIYISRNDWTRFGISNNININNIFSYPVFSLDKNLDNLNFQKCMDFADVVVIEMVEPAIIGYSYGFLQFLDKFLDTYSPLEKKLFYPEKFDITSNLTENAGFMSGFFLFEKDFVWTEKRCYVDLKTDAVKNGLQIDFSIPNQVFILDSNPDLISITINDTLVYEEEFYSGGTKCIKIAGDKLHEVENEFCTVEINISKDFCPREIGESSDDRHLAIQLKYVGGIK